MKYAIVLPDGAADEPVAELGGKTPLESAGTPNLDWIATHGVQGRVVTAPAGFLPGSDVCTLSVLGCEPKDCYTGRAPLEAAARDIKLAADDVVFRCNLVTIANGRMADFTAGHIDQPQAGALIAELNRHFAGEGLVFHEGVQYRHLLVVRGGAKLGCKCTPPHDIPDQPVARHMPSGSGADRIQDIMQRAAGLLETHEINDLRRELGENPANSIWLWGQGTATRLAPYRERFGLSCACIAAVDLIRGITRLLGFEQIEVSGATGFLDTDYAGKGAAAAKALDRFDLVCVHIEAPDEAGHLGNVAEKRLAIERVDAHVVCPLLEKLRGFDEWRILIAPDHPTPVGTRVHSAAPPPFCMAGTGIVPGSGRSFGESNASQSGELVDPGSRLIERFIHQSD